jgi:hypothetical protein
MKSILRLSLLLVIITASITSCKKSAPKATKHIPKNAVAVATINTKTVQGKLAKNQGSIENILKSLSGNDSSATQGKQEWEDLKTSGIDWTKTFIWQWFKKAEEWLIQKETQ